MKVRAIIPNQRGNASAHWRILGPLTAMRANGVDALWYYNDDMQDADFRDAIVIIHRMIPSEPVKYLENLMERGAKSILYSLDDYTFNEEVLRQYLVACGGLTTSAIATIVERVERQRETIQLCDTVIVTTIELADLVSEQLERPVLILPNAIDEKWFMDGIDSQAPLRGNAETVYIGYASGRRPSQDLMNMAKAWKRIQDEFSNVRFVVAGFQPDEIDREIDLDRKIRIPWKDITQYPSSMQVDIGCCPVSSDIEFNRGKSVIKWMEYTLGGAAVVASPFYDVVIINTVNGYIAQDNSIDSWYSKLKHLVQYKMAREALQDRAYYQIKNYMSLDATIDGWIETLKEIDNED